MKDQNPLKKKRGSTSQQKIESRLQKSAEFTAEGQRQSKMTEYMKVLNEHELILQENSDLKVFVKFLTDKLASLDANSENIAIISEMPTLLRALVTSHIENKDKRKGGERYNNDLIRKFATLSKDLGGKQLYEFWSKNLPIPSATTVSSDSKKSSRKIIEGEFRFAELVQYLDSLKLPRNVWLSEDATRCIARIEYDERSNQIIGFTPTLDDNGLPKVLSFEATSAEIIKKMFVSESVSNYIYVIMAQPLADVPAFCLCVFGTDSKFTATQIFKRWAWLRDEAKRFDIILSGLSADGDEKNLLSMKQSIFNCELKVLPGWEKFFFAPMDLDDPPPSELELDPLCTQDIIHIGAKMKTHLLKEKSDKEFMPMGDYFVSGSFLKVLVDDSSKLEHGLCISDLDSKDKMNFRSVQKITDDRVITALDHIPGAKGTKQYLVMMRDILDAFLDKNVSCYKRLYLSWRSLFFLRIWRAWLEGNGYSVVSNCVTRNAYQCSEISIMSLTNAVRRLRIYKNPQLFLPWLMSSQPCEGLFRSARSLSSMFLTAVNMSPKVFIERVDKIERISRTTHELSKSLNIPRHHKKMVESQGRSENLTEEGLPEDAEILKAIMEAKTDARSMAEGLNMRVNSDWEKAPLFILNMLKKIPTNATYEEEDEDEPSEVEEIADPPEEMPVDVAEDIFLQNENPLQLDFHEHSTNVMVEYNGEQQIMKKKTLVWLLSSKKHSISSNRLERVKAALETLENYNSKADKSEVSVAEDLSIGDWAIFGECPLPNRVYVGRILNFSYLSGEGKARVYSKNHVPISEPLQNPRGVGCMAYWYVLALGGSGKLEKLHEPHKYHNLKDYICTIPMPTLRNGQWSLPKDITTAVKIQIPRRLKCSSSQVQKKSGAGISPSTSPTNTRSRKSGRTLFPDSDSSDDNSDASPSSSKLEGKRRARGDSERSLCCSPKRARKSSQEASPRKNTQQEAVAKQFPALSKTPSEGDYVLVEFQTKMKHKFKYYVAKVLKDIDKDKDFEVSYFRRKSTGPDKFQLPPVPDLASTPLDSIKLILPKPTFHESGRRQEDFYQFNVSFEGLNIG